MRISDWSSDLCASDLLVIGALEEGGIDRRERPHSLRRQPGGECYRMLFGDADVKTAFGVRLREFVDPRPRRHRGGDRDDAPVAFGQLRSEEHTSELQSLMRISYAVFCLKKQKKKATAYNI